MKFYNNRNELKEDVDFITSIVTDLTKRDELINQLFEQWMYTSPDSPFNDHSEEDISCAQTLVTINQMGVSSEWKGQHIVFEDVSPKKPRYNLRSGK